MKPVRLSPEANDELRDAYAFYETRIEGLGDDLLNEFDLTLEHIRRRPASYERVPRVAPSLGVRRAPLPRFPFSIVFLELRSDIRVIAFAAQRKRPRYWLRRIK